MPVLWKNCSNNFIPGRPSNQCQCMITEIGDEVSLLLTINEPPYGLRMYLHNTSGTVQSPNYEIYVHLMALAQNRELTPQISDDMALVELTEENRELWFGVKSQSLENNAYLLVNPFLSTDRSLVFGVAPINCSTLCQITLVAENFSEKVFDIIVSLKNALIAHNENHGHWYA